MAFLSEWVSAIWHVVTKGIFWFLRLLWDFVLIIIRFPEWFLAKVLGWVVMHWFLTALIILGIYFLIRWFLSSKVLFKGI